MNKLAAALIVGGLALAGLAAYLVIKKTTLFTLVYDNPANMTFKVDGPVRVSSLPTGQVGQVAQQTVKVIPASQKLAQGW